MGVLDDDVEIINGYEKLEQNLIDQTVVNNSQTLVPSGGEQLGVRPNMGTAVTGNSIGGKYMSALTAAQSPEEFDAQVAMFKAELNANQSTLVNLGMAEGGTPSTGSALLSSVMNGNFPVDPGTTQSFIDKVQYNFITNTGPTNIAGVPSVLTDWERDNGFYLAPDEFGIDRKFKNGIMVLEDLDKVSILHRAHEKAVHDAFTELLDSSSNVSLKSVKTDSSYGPTLSDAIKQGLKLDSLGRLVWGNSANNGLDTKPIPYAIKLTSSSDNTFLVAPKDNLTGPINFRGVSYKLRVPFFNMSSNADIYSGGWTTVGGPYDYSISGLAAFSFPEFFGNIKSPDPKTDAKVINLLSLIVGVGDSVANSYHPAPIQILVQQKDGESCLIIQAGVGGNVFQTFAGKTVEGPVDNKYFRVTLDAQHSVEPFTHFVSVDANGNFVFTRKLYSGDKVEEKVNGQWNDCTAEYMMKSVQASDNVLFRSIQEKLNNVIKPIPRIYAI